MLSQNAIEEFKSIYLKRYGVQLNNEQAMAIGNKLIQLFKIIRKPIPVVDRETKKENNKNNV